MSTKSFGTREIKVQRLLDAPDEIDRLAYRPQLSNSLSAGMESPGLEKHVVPKTYVNNRLDANCFLGSLVAPQREPQLRAASRSSRLIRS